jgi:glutamyl-tRNA reductase
VITTDKVAAALRLRELSAREPVNGEPANGEPRPLVLLDLALPRDVEPGVAGLPGVTVLGLDSLQEAGAIMAATQAQDVADVRAIVMDELTARVSARNAARVAPTVVALRAKAAEVVETELARLGGKLGDLDDQAHAEIAQAMHRVVDKLLHGWRPRSGVNNDVTWLLLWGC